MNSIFLFGGIGLLVSKSVNANVLFLETGLEWMLFHELAEPDGCK